MCLIFICQHAHPDYPLIIAANRDEFYPRPTVALQQWQDHPQVIAGRDLQAGGSWLGVSKNGRLAAITNHRMRDDNHYHNSRGSLVTRFLTGTQSTSEFATYLQQTAESYAGYNCVFGTLTGNPRLFHYNNTEHQLTELQAGVHGVSNASLDTPWFKLREGKQALETLLQQPMQHEAWLKMMTDQQQAADNELPDTGIDKQLEASLSSRFIHLPHYGTRCTTLITLDNHNQLSICERSYNEQAEAQNTQLFRFSLA